MTDSPDDLEARTKLAIETCEGNIVWFARTKKQARLLHRFSQVSVIALGALTPVLILFSGDNVNPSIPKWLQALPAALSSIFAGLTVAFNPRESWVSRSVALEALHSELFKFRTKTSQFYSPELDPQTALDNFVQRVDQINNEELGNWRNLQLKDSFDASKKE